MFQPALFRCAGSLVVLGLTACVCSLSAQDTARIERWIAALHDSNPDVREAAAVALQKQGTKAKAALPALKKALKDKETSVSAAVSRALLDIDEALTHTELLRRLNNRKLPAEERRQVCRELAKNNWDDGATAAALEEMLSDPDVKELAAAALKYLRARRGVGPALLRTIPKGGPGLAFSPDGNLLASADKLWDTLTGKEVAGAEDAEKLRKAARSSASEALSSDGKIRATGVSSDSVRLNGSYYSSLTVPGAITALAFSPTSKTLAGGYNTRSDGSGKVILWDVATTKALTTYKVHSGKVTCVAFSPHGKYLASAGADKKGELGEIKVWDPRTGQGFVFLQDSSVVVQVAFSPDGKLLASVNRDRTIKLWAVEVLLSARNKTE